MENLTLRKAIEMAVATEDLGAKYYQEIANKFSSEGEVARVFEQLAEDEAAHEIQFKKLLDEVPPEKDVVQKEEAGLLLRAAATSQFFDQRALEDIVEIATPDDALAKALAFERSTLFFYQSILEILGDSPQLKKLVEAEKSHVTTLMRVIVSDAKFRGLADPW